MSYHFYKKMQSLPPLLLVVGVGVPVTVLLQHLLLQLLLPTKN